MHGINIMKGFSTLNLTGTLITVQQTAVSLGPPIPITFDMVKKAISKMKSGKAAGPSGIVVEMIKAEGDAGATMIHNLATVIIRVMARSQLTVSKLSLSAFTSARVMLWTEATIKASS